MRRRVSESVLNEILGLHNKPMEEEEEEEE